MRRTFGTTSSGASGEMLRPRPGSRAIHIGSALPSTVHHVLHGGEKMGVSTDSFVKVKRLGSVVCDILLSWHSESAVDLNGTMCSPCKVAGMVI